MISIENLKHNRKESNPFRIANKLAGEDPRLSPIMWIGGFTMSLLPYVIAASVEGGYRLKESFNSRKSEDCEMLRAGKTYTFYPSNDMRNQMSCKMERILPKEGDLMMLCPIDECPYGNANEGKRMIHPEIPNSLVMCNKIGIVEKAGLIDLTKTKKKARGF